jgi:hypothetical protein
MQGSGGEVWASERLRPLERPQGADNVYFLSLVSVTDVPVLGKGHPARLQSGDNYTKLSDTNLRQ